MNVEERYIEIKLTRTDTPAIRIEVSDGEKSGYEIQKNNQAITGYRIYAGKRTLFFPAESVLYIDMRL